MTKRINLILAIFALAVGLPFYWLLLDNRSGDARPMPVTMAQLRDLAASDPGPRPARVAVARVALRHLSGDLLAAGSGIKRRQYTAMAYRLDVPGKGPVVIDSGVTARDAATIGFTAFSAEGRRAVDEALREASLVLVTSERSEHVSGFDAVPGASARLAAPATRAPVAVAPGIVVIPTSSPTPGSQMIYVRLADGAEYLFAGDVAPMAVSWQQQRSRARWKTDVADPEDRDASFAWLATIARLHAQAPDLRIIPGHDYEWLTAVEQASWIAPQFPGMGRP